MYVSFCVIAYNEEKALKSLFNDINNQDYPHDKMEVVLVNSMSTDHTKELMNEFKENNTDFKSILILDNPKKIQAAGWNIAIKAASGDVIFRIDAHTMIPEKFVSQGVDRLREGENVVGGIRPNISEEDTPWCHTLLVAEKSMFGSSIAMYRRSNKKSYVKSVFHGAYRKEVFEKAGMFDEKLGRTEDNELHYRIRKAGYKICYDPKIISYQHIRNSWQGMIKQKYANGYWIGLTVGVCPGCLSFYHIIPLGFVIMLIVSFIALLPGIYWPLKWLCIIYAIVNLIMTIVAIMHEKKYWQYVVIPLVFLSLHISYGVGTIVGLFKMPFWKRKVYNEKGKYS